MDSILLDRDEHDAAAGVVLAFFRLVDQGRASETVELFEDDASITFAEGSPQPGTIRGGAIGVAMRAREGQRQVTTRHVITNIHITRNEDGSLQCRSLLTLYRSEDGTLSPTPRTIADVDDRLVQVGTTHRIASRVITPVFGLV